MSQCHDYPDYCGPGGPLRHSLSLLQTQESMFIIGSAIDFIFIISKGKSISQDLKSLQASRQTHITEIPVDKITYQQVSTIDY